MDDDDISDEVLRRTVGESFNIFQSTIAICSIFMGFVFAAILQLLAKSSDPTIGEHVAAWFLVIAMLLLLFAVICFHATAHQVVRYWKIFLPRSRARTVGAMLFPLGIVSMLLATTAMLWSKGMLVLSALPTFAAFVLTLNLLRGNRSQVGV